LPSGIFPCRLKYAEVVPLFKKGDKKKQSRYRPGMAQRVPGS